MLQHYPNITSIQIEKCFYVETSEPISSNSEANVILKWLLKHPQEDYSELRETSAFVLNDTQHCLSLEIGPRFNFSTPFSTNCINICHNVGLKQIKRLEASNRYLIRFDGSCPKSEELFEAMGDRMTECIYTEENIPTNSFDEQLLKSEKSWYIVPIMEQGRAALEEVNLKLGLAFGDWDLEYYTNLFKNILQRNPSTVELFDCAQSNSEHSRHWFFRGKMLDEGVEQPKSLIRMIMDTQQFTNANNTIKFSDNSSAIKGFIHSVLKPVSWVGPSKICVDEINSNLIFTAETHNMPTAVAPFSGATTGTGGRLRDVQATGRGGIPIAGTAGYCVGCLNIPG